MKLTWKGNLEGCGTALVFLGPAWGLASTTVQCLVHMMAQTWSDGQLSTSVAADQVS